MSRVATLQHWAEGAGAELRWIAPYSGEYAVLTTLGSMNVLTSGTDAGQAAQRALEVLGIDG